MKTDFFSVVGSLHNVFLIVGIFVALGLAVAMTFFRESLSEISADAIERWSRPLVVSIKRWIRPWVNVIARWIPAAPPPNREKRRNRRAGKKRAGAKRGASQE